MVKSKEFMTVESYLLDRYANVTKQMLDEETTEKEFEILFHMKKEISETLLKCGILTDEELSNYNQGIIAKVHLEQNNN